MRPHALAYRSTRLTLLGLPLVDVSFGPDPSTGKRRCAVSIFAIGERALGVVAVGVHAAGAIAIGPIAVGGIAIGAIAIGFAAFGAVGIGWFAAGAVALGAHAFGAVANFVAHGSGPLGFGKHP